MEADLDYVEDASVVESGTATLQLRRDGALQFYTLLLDLEKRTFEMRDAAGTTLLQGKSEDVSTALIKAWFEGAGIATEGEAVGVAMRDARRMVTACFDDPKDADNMFPYALQEYGALKRIRGSSNSSQVGPLVTPAPRYWTARTWLIVAVLGSVYLIACVLIWWRRRWMLAR
jgi:hypothetical protein